MLFTFSENSDYRSAWILPIFFQAQAGRCRGKKNCFFKGFVEAKPTRGGKSKYSNICVSCSGVVAMELSKCSRISLEFSLGQIISHFVQYILLALRIVKIIHINLNRVIFVVLYHNYCLFYATVKSFYAITLTLGSSGVPDKQTHTLHKYKHYCQLSIYKWSDFLEYDVPRNHWRCKYKEIRTSILQYTYVVPKTYYNDGPVSFSQK